MTLRSQLVVGLAIAATGCAARPVAAPLDVRVRGGATPCTVEVGGRSVTLDELSAIARSEAAPGRRARITIDDTTDTPYRCIGGAVYTLQSAGFRDVKVENQASRVR